MNNEELVQRYQEGDREALDKLLEQNKGIIHKIAYKFYVGKSNAIDQEDLIQEGYIGLMIAARKYNFCNPKKAQFITYAIYWIYSKINRFMHQRGTNEEVSLNTPLNDEDVELIDVIADKSFDYDEVEESIYYQDIRVELEEVMEGVLTLKEQMIVKMHYGWDGGMISLDEIAELCDEENKQSAIKTKNRALEKIRKTPWARKAWQDRLQERDYTYWLGE